MCVRNVCVELCDPTQFQFQFQFQFQVAKTVL